MTNYDVFNGDADGILSLVQLRQVEPKDSILITGVKRDIALLQQVPVDDVRKQITVLDVSMEKNIGALQSQLESNSEIFYADHHRAGDIPEHQALSAHIDLDANVCTALIIDKLLQGKKHLWAIAAAYGDNLIAKADELSSTAGLSLEQAQQLKELGTLVNYNGYGESLNDLHFEPSELFRELMRYDNPFDCINDLGSVYAVLKQAYEADHQKARSASIITDEPNLLAIQLEDAAWARRISGVYGNELANQNSSKAILVVTKNDNNSYRISLRAPISNKQGAGDICSQFDTGGGREAAAGINHLPEEQLPELLAKVKSYYSS